LQVALSTCPSQASLSQYRYEGKEGNSVGSLMENGDNVLCKVSKKQLLLV